MSQFYAKAEDEERCLQSSITRQSVMVQGLTTVGLRPFSGIVLAVEKGDTPYPDYPLRITMK
jgi:20S proteasome alpha/beta subunit